MEKEQHTEKELTQKEKRDILKILYSHKHKGRTWLPIYFLCKQNRENDIRYVFNSALAEVSLSYICETLSGFKTGEAVNNKKIIEHLRRKALFTEKTILLLYDDFKKLVSIRYSNCYE